MKFIKNKHIINYIRNFLNDKDDLVYDIEEKVDIINEAIKMYSKYIYNYKQEEVSSENGLKYTLSKKANFINSVKDINKKCVYMERQDYYINDFGDIIFYSENKYRIINVVYDTNFEYLDIQNLGNLVEGNNTIIISNDTYYDIGDFILLKDETKEEVCIIEDKDGNEITFKTTSEYTDSYMIGNSKVGDFEILGIYSQYYNSSKKTAGMGSVKSESWSQGGRSRSISYGTNTGGKGDIGNDSLDLFVTRLKNDVNYKFKEFEGIDVMTNYK